MKTIFEQEIINTFGEINQTKCKMLKIPGFKQEIKLGIIINKGNVYILENGHTMEFSKQDIEIQEAITKELRNKNYDI